MLELCTRKNFFFLNKSSAGTAKIYARAITYWLDKAHRDASPYRREHSCCHRHMRKSAWDRRRRHHSLVVVHSPATVACSTGQPRRSRHLEHYHPNSAGSSAVRPSPGCHLPVRPMDCLHNYYHLLQQNICSVFTKKQT